MFLLFWSTWKLGNGRTTRRTEKVRARNMAMLIILPLCIKVTQVCVESWGSRIRLKKSGRAESVSWHPTSQQQANSTTTTMGSDWRWYFHCGFQSTIQFFLRTSQCLRLLTKWARRAEKYEVTVTLCYGLFFVCQMAITYTSTHTKNTHMAILVLMFYCWM